jgi:hypothetical protein
MWGKNPQGINSMKSHAGPIQGKFPRRHRFVRGERGNPELCNRCSTRMTNTNRHVDMGKRR